MKTLTNAAARPLLGRGGNPASAVLCVTLAALLAAVLIASTPAATRAELLVRADLGPVTVVATSGQACATVFAPAPRILVAGAPRPVRAVRGGPAGRMVVTARPAPPLISECYGPAPRGHYVWVPAHKVKIKGKRSYWVPGHWAWLGR